MKICVECKKTTRFIYTIICPNCKQVYSIKTSAGCKNQEHVKEKMNYEES